MEQNKSRAMEQMSLAELRALATEKGLTAFSALRKAQLIDRLRAETGSEEAPAPAEEITETKTEEITEAKTAPEERQRFQRERKAYTERTEASPAPRPSVRQSAQEEDRAAKRSPERRDNLRITRMHVSESGVTYDATRSSDSSPRQFSESRPSPEQQSFTPPKSLAELDSGEQAEGILEVLADGYGFIRSGGYLSGDDDIYVAPSQIKRFNLKTGDYICGNRRIKAPGEKFSAILFINSVNGVPANQRVRLTPFENLTPVFPKERLHLETSGCELSLRIVDLLSPIGKGQRGMIVAQPKVGKTTLLKQIAHALLLNHPELTIIILLIDERPEEVTDMKESVAGPQVEVVYSTFDELPEHHKKVSEMVIERAKRLVEGGRDVVILLDSITRLTRAYNITVTPSGRTLSGGLDPAALYMPKRFFGAARCMREGGSLTILATALIETGSRLDDMVYEEFKGTGNMELVLNRKLSERRIFPAIDILKSSTRNDSLLLTEEEQEASATIRRVTAAQKPEEAAEKILDLFALTKVNSEFIQKLRYMVF